MFRKLKRKIIAYVLVISIVITLTISITSFYFVSQSIYNNFKYSAEENITQSIKNSNFSIQAAKTSTVQISQNENIIEMLKSPQFNYSINPILNTLKNTSYGIAGVTLYTTNGLVYSTDNITSLTFDEMEANPLIHLFIQSEDTTYLSIRTSQIALLYNHVPYDPQYGMITYLVKIYDNANIICGYLFVDINPIYLYNNFFTYPNDNNFKNVETYIVTPTNTYLKSDVNTTLHNGYLQQAKLNATIISKDRKYLIITNSLYSNDSSMVTLVPMNTYYIDLIYLSISLIVTSLILIGLSYVVAIKMTNSILTALNHLHKKMENTELIP